MKALGRSFIVVPARTT